MSSVAETKGKGSRSVFRGRNISPGVSGRSQLRREEVQSLPELNESVSVGPAYGQAYEIRKESLADNFSDITANLSRYEELMSEIGRRNEEPGLDRQYDQVSIGSGGISEIGVTRSDTSLTPAVPARAPVECVTDPDEAWKAFVFSDGNTDDVESQAFHEAKRDAARKLQPSDCSTCTTEIPLSECDSIIPAPGTLGTRNELSNGSGIISSPVSNPSSCLATLGASSERPSSALSCSSPITAKQLAGGQSGEGHSGSFPTDRFTNDTGALGNADSSEVFVDSTVPSTGALPQTSMHAEPAQSAVGASEAQFKFAPPKAFIGNRSVPNPMAWSGIAARPIAFAGRKRGWQRKRAHDGRADIRAFPNYSSDPIEDIQDDVSAPPSLFGPLEMT